MGRKSIDLTSRIFGKLKVESRNYNKGNKNSYWNCICECGNKTIVTYGCLNSKGTKSCGCLRIENNKNNFKKYNKYDLTGEYGIGYTTKNEKFYFDLEDYDKIKDYCWHINSLGYMAARINNNYKLQHKIILLKTENMHIDHINHITYDNRKKNLRICTPSQNGMNKQVTNNATGYRGVYKHRNKYEFRLTINGKTMSKGGLSLEDAIKARKEAEIKYFGEYRYKGDEL